MDSNQARGRDGRTKGGGRSAGRVTVAAHEIGYDGGQERVTAELICGLLKRGYEVSAVALRCDLAPHARLRFRRVHGPRRPASIASVVFYVVGSLRVWLDRGDFRHSSGAVVANAIDVTTVHFCNGYYQDVVGVKRHSRPGLAYRINEALYNLLARGGERWSYRPGRTKRLVPVSSGLARELEQFFPSMRSAIRVIPNGVDGECFHPDPETRAAVRTEIGLGSEDLIAVFLGGDWERKGLRHSIGAMATAPDWYLMVVGEGDMDAFRAIAVQMNVDARIRFVGKRTDSWRLLAAGDAFVLPSSYEAFPLSALEAAASGLPLLGTRVNGLEELIVDGENGFFVETDPGMIGRRLAQLAADPDLRRRMAFNARVSTRRYSWPAIVDSYASLLRELEPRLTG